MTTNDEILKNLTRLNAHVKEAEFRYKVDDFGVALINLDNVIRTATKLKELILKEYEDGNVQRED